MPLPPSLQIDPASRRVRLDPADQHFVQNPYAAYRAVRDVAPRFFWEEYGFWCFAAYDDVMSLLRDRRFGRDVLHLTSREALGWKEPEPHTAPFHAVEAHSMLEREPPAHTRLRTLVNRAFVSRNVERLRPRIFALFHQLVDGFEGAGAVELIDAFATPIPILLIAELIGVPAEMAPQLLDWSHRMVAMYQYRRTRSDEIAAAAASEAFVSFLRTYVAERRSRPADDLISHLIAAEAAGDRLSESELVSTCILLLNAGHEATVHAIGNGVTAVLRSGLDPSGLLASAEGAADTVEELLRLDAPLHLFTRYALEPLDLGGISLAVGDEVGLLLGAANRDPLRFAEPDRLWPERPKLAHASFGAGIHFCLGAPLARLELALALPILFSRLPGLRLAAPPRYRDSYHFHGLEALHLRW
jgi:cytochrome P450